MKNISFLCLLLLLTISDLIAENTNVKEINSLKKEIQNLKTLIEKQNTYYQQQLSTMKSKIDAVTKNNTIKVDAENKELALLKQTANQEVAKHQAVDFSKTNFKAGGLSLQALNPEISITGDLIESYFFGDDIDHNYSDFNFRTLGLHFESYLDPYSKFKAAVPVTENTTTIGEAYFTRYGIFNGINLTLGKFRQQFGVINRFHKHGLNFLDFPLPIRKIFGAGGLNQTGISLEMQSSFFDSSQELLLQITDGDNSYINTGNSKNRPNILLHFKNYYDLSDNTYLETGCSSLFAWNDQWNVYDNNILYSLDDTLLTKVFGLDFTLLWEPTSKMRYRNFEWRVELYLCQKEILAYDDSDKDTLESFGWYTSINSKISRNFNVGIHFDYFEPDTKEYASINGFPYYDYAVSSENSFRTLTSVYVTWMQSPFVKFRLEYNHEEGDNMGESSDSVMLQTVFAAGPHKHERY